MDIDTNLTEKYEDHAIDGYNFLKYLYYNSNANSDYALGNKIVFAKIADDKIYEKITISGQDYDEDTCQKLLLDQAHIIEMQIVFEVDGNDFPIYIKAKDMDFSGIKTPKVEDLNDPNDFAVKIAYIKTLLDLVNKWYKKFLNDYNNWDEYNTMIENSYR